MAVSLRCTNWRRTSMLPFCRPISLVAVVVRMAPPNSFGLSGVPVSKPVADQIFVDNLLENPHTVLPKLFEVVVSRFEGPPVLPFGLPRDGFGCGLGGFVDLLSRKAKPIAKKFSPLINCHAALLFSVKRAGVPARDWRFGRSQDS